jgi:hypothetical protein
MALCSDPSLTFLKNIGYNVVRLPREGVEPLTVIGWSKDSAQILGTLPDLVTGDKGVLPSPRSNAATNIKGQKSSSLKIGIGVSILNGMLAALGGGTLSAGINYTNARKISFIFDNVTSTLVDAIPVGSYLRDGDIDQTNPISLPFLTGSGRLLVIVDALKSNKISVQFESSNGVGASIDVPVISGAVGGKLDIDSTRASEGILTFEGDKLLTFGFKCFQIQLDKGELRMVSVPAGGAFLTVDDEQAVPDILIGGEGEMTGMVEWV